MNRAHFVDSRRRLLKAGLFGGLGLALLGGGYAWLRGRGERAPIFDQRARALIAAVAPAVLDGALPEMGKEEAGRQEAMLSLQAAVGAAIAGLSPAQREELGQLFALLEFPVTRSLVAGVHAAWSEATLAEVDAFLRRWRASRFELLRSAYCALHDLILGAWYARPESWAAIGYPGPPSL